MRHVLPAELAALLLLLGCEPTARDTAAAPFDLVIRNGTLVDGTGAPPRRADVGIRGDEIAEVGPLAAARAERSIDARGRIVAPGFIDMHSHSEIPLLVDGRALSKVTQGVTTELLGESGSAGPILGPARVETERALGLYEIELDWETLGEYFAKLEGRISVNVLSTVGSGQLRAAVIGYENRSASAEELARMESLAEAAMREGAVGLSSGLIYAPNSYASTEELIALARVAGRHGGIYLTHIRGEGDALLAALEEAIRIGREAALPVEVLHFKRSRPPAQDPEPSIEDAAALIERAQREGVTIYANLYPYAASQTSLGVVLPDWAHEGGRESLLARLRDGAARARMREEISHEFAKGIRGRTPETILFGRTPYEPHRRFQGRTIEEISAELGLDPVDTVLELVDRAEGQAAAIYFGMREQDVRFALKLPWTTIGSDGSAVSPEGVLGRSHPHPRWYGTFPRVLGHYVREEGLLSLPEAIHKMTALPASRLGLSDRGTVAKGMKADLVVFDPRAIRDRATFAEPHQFSEGVHWLLVNGEVVIEEGQHSGALPGRVLGSSRGRAF